MLLQGHGQITLEAKFERIDFLIRLRDLQTDSSGSVVNGNERITAEIGDHEIKSGLENQKEDGKMRCPEA